MADLMKRGYIKYAKFLELGDLARVKTGKDRTELINKIADMYCEAARVDDDFTKNAAISGLMLLFYGEISKMFEKCKAIQGKSFEDYAQKVFECINVACSYQAWKDGHTTAEACIRSAIASRGTAAILYTYNLDKNKANANIYSLDAPIETDESKETSRADVIVDDLANNYLSDLNTIGIIQEVINKGKVVESIILDNIAFNDCQKETSETKVLVDTETGKKIKYTKKSSELSKYYLAKALNNLPDEYKDYFMHRYSVKEAAIEAAIKRLKTSDSSKLYKFIKNTLVRQRAIMELE